MLWSPSIWLSSVCYFYGILVDFCNKHPQAPQFNGFVEGGPRRIGNAAGLPPPTVRFGPHACFGCRALAGQLDGLTEVLEDAVGLCGTETLACPRINPHSSPDQVLVHLLLEDRFDGGDFAETEEDLERIIERLGQEQEGEAPARSTTQRVGRSCSSYPAC